MTDPLRGSPTNPPTDYDTLKAAIEAGPSASYWLKSAVAELETRDPVDAENDVLGLARLYRLKNHELIPSS